MNIGITDQTGGSMPDSWGHFLAVGVSRDASGAIPASPRAVQDVRALSGVLGESFVKDVLTDPTEQEVRNRLKRLEGSMPDGGPLFVFWSGPSLAKADRLRLLASDSRAAASSGVAAEDLMAYCAAAGANQILLVLDTYSDTGLDIEKIAADLIHLAEAPQVWVGVVAGYFPPERGHGHLAKELLRILSSGPNSPELRMRWSSHNKHIRGDDPCDALLKEWVVDFRSPAYSARGSAWWMFPNPLWVDDAPERPPPSAPVVRPQMLPGAAPDTVPEPGEGRVRAADRLGTAVEVEMLVSVLLAQDTPLPLAVGLFGDWGSGKSFFMALMEERMCELARLAADGRPEAAPFCREIRAVRFNAWHYVDTDLWASLAATLFDELARSDSPDRAEAALAGLDQARQKVEDAAQRRTQLESEIADLTAKTGRARAAVRPSLSVALQAVRTDKDLLAHPQALARGHSGEYVSADRLASALEDVQTLSQRVHAIGRLLQEEVLYRRRSVTLVTLGIFVSVAVSAWVLLNWSLAGKLSALLGAVIAGVSPALTATMRLLYLARDAREARELPLVEKREQLAQAVAEEQAAQHEVERHEKELAELRDKGLQLQRFVRERAASSDYRSRLGVISQVRRDFEQLVDLLPGDKPAGAEQVAAVAAEVARRVPEVERIVLFIDDLDRCPPPKVVEVLQAVHLLLAFKLFVVVVGVDSQWLERSLRAHYANLLDEPERYLEKIFQIPFRLRSMTLPLYRDLITQLTPAPTTKTSRLIIVLVARSNWRGSRVRRRGLAARQILRTSSRDRVNQARSPPCRLRRFHVLKRFPSLEKSRSCSPKSVR